MRTGAVIWIVAAVGIATALAALRLVLAKSSARRFDAGSVSSQWITEHIVGSDNGIG